MSGFLFYSSERKNELLVSLPKMEKNLPEIGHTTYICTQRGPLCKWISLVWAWSLSLPYYIIASPSYTLMQLGRKGNMAQSPINFSCNHEKLRERVEKYLGKSVLKEARDNAGACGLPTGDPKSSTESGPTADLRPRTKANQTVTLRE